MTRTRTFLAALALTGTLGLGTALTGCDATDSDSALAASENVPLAALSPQTLFEGVMLGNGPAAAALPDIHQMQTPDAESRAFYRFVVDGVRADDPAYFDAFAAGITSGNHTRVSQTIDEAGVRILRVMATHPDPEIRAAASGTAGEEHSTSIADDSEGTVFMLVDVHAVAIAYYNAIWRYVAQTISEVEQNKAGISNHGPALQREQIVASVTERLAR